MVSLNLKLYLVMHCRLGHINKKCIAQLQKDGVLESFDHKSDDVCESSLLRKMTKSPFIGSCERDEGLLDIIHTNVCGPFRSTTRDANRFYVSFTDDYRKYGYIYLIKHESETFEKFKEFKNELNGVAERRKRTLLDMVSSMMSQASLPIHFWGYALETAAHILNLVPTKKLAKTPHEMWTGKVPSLAHIKVWGCEAFIRRETHDKLVARSVTCVFIGYHKQSFGYLFYRPSEDVVFVARQGVFRERELIFKEATGSTIDLEEIQESSNEETLEETRTQQEEEVHVGPTDNSLPLKRSSRVSMPPELYGFHITTDGDTLVSDRTLVNLDEPASYKEAVAGPEAAKWKEPMDSKIKSMYDNQVWNLVDNLPGRKTAGCKWILKKKTDMDGKPEGFVDAKYPNKVYKLEKSIYGLKKASRSSNLCFHEKVKEFSFSRSEDEACVYVKASGSIVTFLVLYVDHILLMGNDIPTLQDVKSCLGKCFAMKYLGEAAYILGIRILRDRKKRLIGLSQSTYLDKVLKMFSMENSKKGAYPAQCKIK
ncbi:hypothetical protein L1887_24056 [Cichorium endivia]|nr:hypothetical protein L1887_24056 [Cichorium endivia]